MICSTYTKYYIFHYLNYGVFLFVSIIINGYIHMVYDS